MSPFFRAILSCGVGCGFLAVSAAASEIRPTPPRERPSIGAPIAIPSGATDAFVPDVYPAKTDAARALGKRLGLAVAGGPLVHVESPSQALSHAFAEGLAAENAALRVVSTAGDLRIALREITAAPKPASSSESDSTEGDNDDGCVSGGTVTLEILDAPDTQPPLPASPISARYVEKPWLADFATFVTSHTDGRWIIAKGDPFRPALNPAEAARAAREAAVDDVVRVLQSKLPRKFARGGKRRAREVVASRLADGGDLVADRFPQSFDRGYGTIYREAVLINASDDALRPLVDEVMRLEHHDRNSRARTVVGGLAVLLVTFVLYRLANFITRGYFTWKLRTVAGIVVVGALLVLTHLP